jgi:hypothetical protein
MISPDAVPLERWFLELTRFRIEMMRLSCLAESMSANLTRRERSTREAEINETIRLCSLIARRLATTLGTRLNLQYGKLSDFAPTTSSRHHANGQLEKNAQ